MPDIRLKRVYAKPAATDGTRILVERLWPRGLTKEAAKIDFWLKELAPSHGLRKWYGHVPERWPEFQRRYREELAEMTEGVAALRVLATQQAVTLVFAARDEERNSAVVLREQLYSE